MKIDESFTMNLYNSAVIDQCQEVGWGDKSIFFSDFQASRILSILRSIEYDNK